jgi:tetratricopeptide (TPR) repeat protein
MDELSLRRAAKHLQSGLDAVVAGEFLLARDRFQTSAENNPTADAYTYWGWMEHQLGDTERAIALCQQAIAIDPQFGNPYNDIGSYRIAQGRIDEAIPWLEKALIAKRYEPRHFPHLNLARVYLAKAMPQQALEHLHKALELNPGDPGILQAIEQTTLQIP